jgi:type I restriction enzyme S subunit
MERQYKDSGVAWAEQIPSNWKVIRGKNLLKLMNRPVRETDDVVTCFRDGEVILRSERRTEGFTMSDKEIGYQGINKGDIVIHGMDGFAGSMGVSKSTGKGSPVLVVCNPKENDDSRYIVYYLRTLAMNNVFVALATGIRERSCDLRWNKISDLPFIRPDADEQKRIADFIDAKIEEIDALITLQDQMITKLTDYKQSVITETVTKGLNPDAQLVPSGIDWIGDIPKGWTICKLKNMFTLLNGRAYLEPELLDAGKYRILRVGNLFSSDKWYYSDMELEENKYCEAGDLLYGWSASIGPYIWKDEKVIYHYHIWKVLFGKNDLNYSFYLLQALTMAKQRDMHGSAMQHLTKVNMDNSKIVMPPLAEQKTIASVLDTKCGEIDRLIETKRQKIETLKEYKKSVIYEAVTGKTDLRDS